MDTAPSTVKIAPAVNLCLDSDAGSAVTWARLRPVLPSHCLETSGSGQKAVQYEILRARYASRSHVRE